MVFSNDILFIHIGKTGGTSAANYLCKTLTEPVYNVIAKRAHGHKFGHEITLEGQRHATLEEALKFIKKFNGKTLKDFKKIVAVIRNPYELEISLFNYYKRLLANQPTILDGAPRRKEIVLKDSFEEFVKGKFYHRNRLNIRQYISVNGKLPANLQIIKFEDLQEEFFKIGKEFGNGNPDFPHLNKTKKTKVEDYVTPELEVFLYRKYRWVFEKGDYQRLF